MIVRVAKKLPDLHGICLIGGGRALIRIKDDSDSIMLETLLEEWCHVLRHDTPLPEIGDHDQVFWAIYGAVTNDWRQA